MKPKTIRTLKAAAIVLAGFAVYWPALRGGWIWDDAAEVVENPVLRDPAGAWKAWIAPTTQDYFPLKTTVQWVEWRLFGLDPLGYHLTSVGLHLLSALLFWRLLVRLRPDREASNRPGFEWLGGLLFAVHPLAVESVAWTAELKNALSLPLLLLAMLATLDHERTGRRGSHWLSFLWFVLAMLAKSSVVMFPFVILLHAWWRRGRVSRRDLIESVPFFAASLVLGLVTVWFQGSRAIQGADLAMGGALSRLAGAGLALVFYLMKFAWPFGLMPQYPRWVLVPPSVAQFWPWLVLGGLAGWLWTRREMGWARGAIFGLGFYAINLVPVLGFVPMSYLRISWVADHFAYLPMLGLIGLVVGGVGLVAERLKPARRGAIGPLAAAGAVLLGSLGISSRGYAAIFGNAAAYWTYSLEKNPGDWLAHNEYGLVLLDANRVPEAMGEFEAALRIRPDYAEADVNLGNALALSGRPDEAAAHLRDAIRLNPRLSAPHSSLGNLLLDSGQLEPAIAEFEEAIRIRPDVAEVHNNLGKALALSGRVPEAVREFTEAIRLEPGYAVAHRNLGVALQSLGRTGEAQEQFEEAARLR
jgi:tetratricopeptide (TPR) repeat protein